jgi:flagellar L-ring protein FlgH
VKPRILALTCAVAGLCGQHACADSLWVRADPNSAYLFADTRARRQGDLLTVLIQENTGINNNDQRSLDKTSASGGNFTMTGSTTGVTNSPVTGAALAASGGTNRSFTGAAQYQSNRVFTDHLTVTVVEVRPNGDLVIDGWRRFVVSGEERVLRVSGVVRPIDIDLGNTVESQYIANFKAIYQGKGQESKFMNHGWLGQALNTLWPF